MRSDARRNVALVLSLAVLAAWAAAHTLAGEAPSSRRPVRNVIVMISDGCGFKHIEAADLYQHGEPSSSAYEKFPCRLAMRTVSIVPIDDEYTPGTYDLEQAWSDFRYVMSGYTDSAAAATAMATGHKTLNGMIGMAPDGNVLKNVLERCEELGMATGVVTTVRFCDATPASFVAHGPARTDSLQIAHDMILASPVDCIMGCGNPWYDRDGRRLDSPSSFASVGGRELWDVLVAGKAGAWDAAHDDANGNGRADAGEWIDADHNGRADDAWTLVTARPEFQALMKGRAPKRVIGMPQVSSTLQQVRSGDPDADAYAVPLTDTVPTLAEMTTAALNVLDDDPDGLFLMVEGGAVDGAAHLNQSARMIEEECDFEAAVNAAIRWVEEHSSWEQTVLIVTADHETGYLTAAPGAWSYEPLVNNGPRKMPGMAWNSGSHTKSLVPFFAKGPLADAFDAAVIGTDPHRGRYIDNTAIGRTLFAAFGEPIRD